MNAVIESLLSRRSVRSYKPTPVSDELLEEILKAGEYAPTGNGSQGTCFVVVKDKGLVNRLSKMNARVIGDESKDPFYGAPNLIIVFADRNRPTHVEDGALAMGNLMNAAHALGVDSCWIHRAKEMFESEEGREMARSWGVPDSYIGIANCILGYHDCEYPQAAPRKSDFVYIAK